jgi:hypothetical protein
MIGRLGGRLLRVLDRQQVLQARKRPGIRPSLRLPRNRSGAWVRVSVRSRASPKIRLARRIRRGEVVAVVCNSATGCKQVAVILRSQGGLTPPRPPCYTRTDV